MLNKLKQIRSNNKIAIVLSLLIFIFVTVVAIRYQTEISQTLKQTDILWLIAGIGCYFVNYISRAYRIIHYSHNQLRLFPGTIRITCLHGFASYFFPMRSGDLALPALLKLYHRVPLITGSRILVRARLLDILSLGILLITAVLFSAPDIDQHWRFIFFMTGLSFLGLPYILIALGNWKKEWLLNKLQCLAIDKDREIRYPSAKEIGQSLLIWFWTGCTIFCVIRSLGIPLAFLDVWFFAAVQLPLQLLPIQGLANCGNHEAGWLVTLSLLGIAQKNAMAVTLSSHIILITYVLLLGAVGALLPHRQQDTQPSD